jgi:hypothetical protein
VLEHSPHLKHLLDSYCHSVSKVKLTFPSLINIKFYFSSDTFNTLNWMHTKSSHNTQTALGFLKEVGLLKNRNGWQFVGDGGSTEFIATNCCNGPLCVAELIQSVFYTLKPEPYFMSRCVYLYIYLFIYTYIHIHRYLVNSNIVSVYQSTESWVT